VVLLKLLPQVWAHYYRPSLLRTSYGTCTRYVYNEYVRHMGNVYIFLFKFLGPKRLLYVVFLFFLATTSRSAQVIGKNDIQIYTQAYFMAALKIKSFCEN